MPPTVLRSRAAHADWLPRQQAAKLTIGEVVQRLRAIAPLIAAEAAEAERQRHPTQRAWSAIRQTGMFYLTVPKEYGGVGIETLESFIEPILTIAENCMSTAWCAYQSVQHQWMIGLFPAAFCREVFSSLPYVNAAGSSFPMGTAAKVDGGYRVNGLYRWGSGILYANWVFAIARRDDADSSGESACFFMPAEDVTILDSWFVDGMAGTGSYDYVIDDVFVPDHRVLGSQVIGLGQLDRVNPLQRAALPVVAPALVPLSILGAARSVVRRYRQRLTAEGVDIGPTGRRGDHIALARAETATRIAELAIRDSIASVQQFLVDAQAVPPDARNALRAQSAYAVEMCRTAARALGDISGSSVHATGNPFQRAIRDIDMLSSHAVIEISGAMDIHGRQLAGLPIEYFRRP